MQTDMHTYIHSYLCVCECCCCRKDQHPPEEARNNPMPSGPNTHGSFRTPTCPNVKSLKPQSAPSFEAF